MWEDVDVLCFLIPILSNTLYPPLMCKFYFFNANILYISSTVIYEESEIDEIIIWLCINIHASISFNHRIVSTEYRLHDTPLTSSVCPRPLANGPDLNLIPNKGTVWAPISSHASGLHLFLWIWSSMRLERDDVHKLLYCFRCCCLPVESCTVLFFSQTC